MSLLGRIPSLLCGQKLFLCNKELRLCFWELWHLITSISHNHVILQIVLGILCFLLYKDAKEAGVVIQEDEGMCLV